MIVIMIVIIIVIIIINDAFLRGGLFVTIKVTGIKYLVLSLLLLSRYYSVLPWGRR